PLRRAPRPALFPYTTLFRSVDERVAVFYFSEGFGEQHALLIAVAGLGIVALDHRCTVVRELFADALAGAITGKDFGATVIECNKDRKSTRLNSSHVKSSYAV